MLYGVREVCDVMVKTTVDHQKVGGTDIALKNTPICHFDSLKTSTMEGASTTVYAQGGQGNPRLVAWDGERTITFTMEDALISPLGLTLLTGAGAINGAIDGEGRSAFHKTITGTVSSKYAIKIEDFVRFNISKPIFISEFNGSISNSDPSQFYLIDASGSTETIITVFPNNPIPDSYVGKNVLIDGYIMFETGTVVRQYNIEPDVFGGNYYFEGSTLWRDVNGVDHAAEFIIPNGKIQSAFTFTMANSGDPSTFTYTVDALPGMLNDGSSSKKVLAAIQIVDTVGTVNVQEPEEEEDED